jgi:hypothetical protein
MSTRPDQGDSGGQPPRKQKDIAPLYTDTLMTILGYGRRNLEANRNGRITTEQRSELQDELNDDVSGLGLLLTISFGMILLMAVIMLSQGMPLTDLVIGALVFLVPMMAFAFFRQSNRRKDMEEDNLSTTEGHCQVYMTGPGASGHAYLVVDGKRFPIRYEQAQELAQYDAPMLRIYHTEHGNKILSAEVMRDSDKLKEKPKNDLMLDDSADDEMDIDFSEGPTISTGRQYDR